MTNFAYTSITNPVFSAADGSSIDCMVTFSDGPNAGKTVPFTAMANDPADHGRAIFAELQAGVHGAIAAFVPRSNVKPTTGVTTP